MKRSIMVGAAVMSLLMAAPAVFAADDEEVVVFGGEFDEPPPVETKPPVEQPSVEPPTVEPPPAVEQPIETQPLDEPPPAVEPQPVEQPTVEPPTVEPPTVEPPVVEQPFETQPLNEEPTPVEPTPPVEIKPIRQRSTDNQPVEDRPTLRRTSRPQTVEDRPTLRPSTATQQPVEDDYIDVGKTIRFNKMPSTEPLKVEPEPVKAEPEPIKPEPVKVEPIKAEPIETEPIKVEPVQPVPVDAEIVDPERNNTELEINEPFKDLTPSETFTFEPQVDQPQPAVDSPYQPYKPQQSAPDNRKSNAKTVEENQPSTTVKKKGKKLKPRFVKLTSDDTFDYYLDKSSVQWVNLPYSASEYMADVWIRMLDKSSSLDDLPKDVRDYVTGQSNDEIAEAEAKGLIYDPVDVKVLSTKRYFLEHYYIRPQKKQIQFLCELEVVGRPQNSISERAYDYKNWENLIPGSVETAIYYGVLNVIGMSKASSRGHMTVTDMVEEYARISIR